MAPVRRFVFPSLVVVLVTAFAACSTGRLPSSVVPAQAEGAASRSAPAAILVPAVHRARISAVDVDGSGRYLLAVDDSGFAAIHDLDEDSVRMVHRIGAGGEPRTFARIDAEATVAFVAWTEDEDDVDAFAIWDLRRDRVTTRPRDFAGWITAIGTNAAIDTIGLVVNDEHRRLEIRDRNLGVRCSLPLDAQFDADDVVKVVVSDDGSRVDVVDARIDAAVRVSVSSCELESIAARDALPVRTAESRAAEVFELNEQILRLGERTLPLSELPSFARGGEFSVRAIAVDPEDGGLVIATRERVIEVSDRGANERCPGTTSLVRTSRGDVLAIGEADFCDVARGNAFESAVAGTLADGRILVAHQADGQGDAVLTIYDPRTGSFSDAPSFVRALDIYATTLLDEGRYLAVREDVGRRYRLIDFATGRETGRIPATALDDGIEFVSQPMSIGPFLGLETGSSELLIVDPSSGRLVRTVSDLPSGYPEVSGRFVRTSAAQDSTFVDVVSGDTRRVAGTFSLLPDGLVAQVTDTGIAIVDLATGRRHNVDGSVVSFDETTRDLATCVEGRIHLVNLDASLAEVGDPWELGTCDAFAQFVRVSADTFARSRGTEVELHTRGAATIVFRIVASDEGFVAFATDESGRFALLGGDAGALRLRPAGDPLHVGLRRATSDPAFEAEVHARLHGRSVATEAVR